MILSVTLGALVSAVSRLVRPIRERTWRYSRMEAVGWPVFEHPYAHSALHGGGKSREVYA